METRVALVAIIVRENASVSALNELLHHGIHLRLLRNVHLVSADDAPRGLGDFGGSLPADVISALSGKIGKLPGITAKTVYAPEDALS